jgi:hypothetical protein
MVWAHTLRKKIESSAVRKEDPRQRGYSKVFRVPENRASGEGLSGYQEVEEGRSAGSSNGIARQRGRLGKRCRRLRYVLGDGYGVQGRRYGVQDHSIHGPPKGCVVGNNLLYMSS